VDDGPDEAANDCCASKRAHKYGSSLRLTNACSAGQTVRADCVEKRDPHRDDSRTSPQDKTARG